MMSIRHILSAIILSAIACLQTEAATFIDKSEPQETFNLGVRIGLNTSNLTVRSGVFNTWNNNGWGTGFEAGAVCNLNFRDFISIQPGVFFECHSGSFTYINTEPISGEEYIQAGHNRSYALSIPIVAQVNFNLSDHLRWSVDFGPYVSLRFKTGGDKVYLPAINSTPEYPILAAAKQRGVNGGIKIGSGLMLNRHYYLGIHYMAAMASPWKTKGMGGREKAWTFTLGYDF